MISPTLAGVIIREGTASSEPEQLLAIVADRRLSVAALSALLRLDSRYSVIDEAHGSVAVRDMLVAFKPGVVVVESVPSGYAGMVDPSAWDGRVLCLLDPEDDEDAFVRAARAHAHGYLSRTASRAAFEEAVACLRDKRSYLDPPVTARLLAAMRHAGKALTAPEPLSQREHDILLRIADGQSTKEIARSYSITRKTVCNHIANIYRKLNLRHRGELVLYAVETGLTSAPAMTPRTLVSDRPA